MARTIQSPGVEIKEVDLSLRPDIPIGTTVLVPGFSQNGPTDELIQVTSVSDFEQVYGKPTTPVERYFYHTVRSSLNSPANVFCSRLAYGAGAGGDLADKYSALVYPVFPRPSTESLEALPIAHPLKQALVNYLGAKAGVTKEIHTISIATSSASVGAQVPTQGAITLVGGATATGNTGSVTIPYDASNTDIQNAIQTLPGIVSVNVTGDFQTLGTDGKSGVTITYNNPNYKDVYNIQTDGTNNTLKYLLPGSKEVWGISSSSLSGGTIALTGTGMTASSVTEDATLNDLETAIKAANASWDITVTSPGTSTFLSGGAVITFNTNGLQSVASLGLDLSNADPDGPSTGQILPAASVTTPGVDDIDLPSIAGYGWTDASGNPYDFSEIYKEKTPSELVVQYVKQHGWKLTEADVYWFGEPSNIDIDGQDYRAFQENRADYGDTAGHVTEWKTYQEVVDKKGMGFILLNTRKLSINEKFEGYYVGVCDNTNLNPATDFDGFLEMKGFNKSTFERKGASYIDVPDVRLNFSLSAAAVGVAGSISEVMENVSPFDLNNQQYSDVLSIGVFKVRPSTLNPDITKLDYVLAESYIGSFNFYAQQYLQEGGEAVSFYLEDETAEAKNFRVMVNPNISKNGGDWYDEKKEVTKKVRVASNKRESNYGSKKEYIANTFLDSIEGEDLYWYTTAMNNLVLDAPATAGSRKLHHGENLYAHGAFKIADGNSAETGNIPAKLDRLFEVAENLDLYPLDILCEAGLGTVYVGTKGGTERFDDEKFYNIGNPDPADPNSDDGLYTTQIRFADDTMANYKTIANRYINFCQTLRKDCLAVLDNLRYIFVQGNDVKVLDDKANKYFSKHIYWPLRHLFGTINSSYACTYGNWVKVQDPASNRQVWVPASGFVAAAMANTDSNFQPWWAPAGFTRGLLSNINDVAFMPKQKHRDQMYKIGVNPIAMFPNDGFVIFGQKTLQSKPSAFDRINVRRMFLYAERAVRNTIKYFVFEPNTLFTRQQVINVLTPIFERIKQTQGLYDYMIVCDDRNNPPDVIDQNEMVVDIYLKPVRSAEFILVNFYATRTSQDFNELIA
jgi:hypothetical protein